MSAHGRRSGRADQVLRRLRWRLTAALTLVAALGVAVFVLALVVLDTVAANHRLDAELRGTASRAAALVYVESAEPQVDAVQDDAVGSGPARLVILADAAPAPPVVLLAVGDTDPGAWADLAALALADEDERGTFQTISRDGVPLRAAAMPWYDDDSIAGAAVAVSPRPGLAGSALIRPAVLGGAVLLALLTMTGALLTRRSLRPAFQAIVDRERFLATAAHELRAPLARLRAGADAVLRVHQADVATTRALQRLVSAADGAGHVVSNLLLATRTDSTEVVVRREQVRVDRLACELEYAYPALVVDIDGPVTVLGDPGLLRHALTNLVENADRHGRIGHDAPLVMLSVRCSDGRPVVRVSDDGPGFPPDVDVLARYVAGPGGGTGLGLALVAWIAEQHGAEVRLSSGPPQRPGATVELLFPHPGPTRRRALS